MDLISGKTVDPKIKLYSQSLGWGLLVIAERLGYLPDADNPEAVREGLIKAKEYIESLDETQLADFRKKLEDDILLSEKDAKLKPLIAELYRKLPESTKALGLN